MKIGVISEDQLARLGANWETTLQPFSVDPAAAQALLDELITYYSAASRFYHNLDHLQHVLDTAAGLQHLAHDFTAVQLAAWFHDAIYDSQATDNEEQSAAYANDTLTRLHIPAATITAVNHMVVATRNHIVDEGDRDSQILLDADLAILGTTPEQYDRYAQAIRREYSWVPKRAYRQGRRRVLERFLQRRQIYYTEPMKTEFEGQARRNLQREISELIG